MKKFILLLSVLALTCVSLFGCNNGGIGTVEQAKTANVKILIAGYGTTWLDETAARFNEVYAEEGYQINIEEKASEINAALEVSVPKKCKTDLYFVSSGSDINTLINKSRSILKTHDEVLLTDLGDIFDSKAIDGEKQETGDKIIDRMDSFGMPYLTYTGPLEQWQDKIYAFPWSNSPTGLMINKKIFTENSYSIPKTTDEMIALSAQIASTSKTTGVYPTVWAGKNAAGYWQYFYDTLFAQYSTVEKYNNFQNCNPDSGNVKDEGWKVYEDEGILKSAEVMEDLVKLDYAPNGTKSMEHMDAQHSLYTGEAAFMVTGNWVYNEMKKDYAEYLGDVEMIPAPVISALGVKLKLDGSGTDAQKCDDILSLMVQLVDENKTNAEIISAVQAEQQKGVTEAQVSAVREARGVYYNLGFKNIALIPSFAKGRDVAKLFLRFLLSDESMKIYEQEANSTLPFDPVGSVETEGNSFKESTDHIVKRNNAESICDDTSSSPIRSTAMIHPFCKLGDYRSLFIKLGDKEITARTFYADQLDWAKKNWTTWYRNSGMK